jgi:flagella basal body P-ring formation protein FlgA
VFTSARQKTLGLFALILLSSVKCANSAEIDFGGKAELLNNLPQLQKMLIAEFDKNNYKVKISLNELNEKIIISNCGLASWQLPAGSVLRGKVSLLARCKNGGETTLHYQPVDIRLLATVPVATRALRFNEQVDGDAIRLEERDVTQTPLTDVLERPESVAGQQTRRSIAQGTVLRRDMFEPLPLIRAGDSIKVVIAGDGFRLSTEAVALQAGQPGQQIRVKTAQGKVLTGAVSAQQIVELKL